MKIFRASLVLTAFILFVGRVLFAASAEGKKDLLPLGSSAPDFHLPDVVSGKEYSLNDFKSHKALLVIVLCRHCPYVQHVKEGIAVLAKDYADKDIAFVALSANDAAAYKEDGPESLKGMALEAGFTFPLLYDESQQVTKALTAVATPDFFLFDAGRKLIYRGQFDSSRPGSEGPVTGRDVRAAIDAVLSDQPVSPHQKPSVGCSIKWKKTNA